MDINDLIENAAQVAHQAHCCQTDKAGQPYIEHPARVAYRVAAAGGSHEAIAVAWLHDAVEDSDLDLEDLRNYGFPETVVEAVDAISIRKGEERVDYYARVAANPLALLVKRADIEDNMDPERLSRLDDRTRARLERKYCQALDYLGRG